MKIQVRRGVFETNSSLVHSLTMCSDDDYQKWKKGEVLFDRWNNKFTTAEEAKKSEYCENVDNDMLSESFKRRYLDYDRFFTSWTYLEFETFEQTYTTPKGEKVHSFGYYGND